LAVAVHDWLPNVLQAVEPWISSEDIEKGSRWSSEIAARLSEVNFGIICLTPENQHAPWLLFEAGTLSKSLATSAVATLLLALRPAEIVGPLSQFQHTEVSRNDVEKLVLTINRRLAIPLSEQKVRNAFELWWPQLATSIEAAATLESVPSTTRNERDLLEELVLQSRAQSKLLRESRFVDWLEDFGRGLKSPPVELVMSFGTPLAAAERSEKGLAGTSCPLHDRHLTILDREPDQFGNTIFSVKGCCNFVMRLAYEILKEF